MTYVTCTTCGRTKKPWGRDSIDNGLCDHDCPGYREEPLPGTCWPGEDKNCDEPSQRDLGPRVGVSPFGNPIHVRADQPREQALVWDWRRQVFTIPEGVVTKAQVQDGR